MFTFCVAGRLESISLDFDLFFAQADIKTDICMEIPLGCNNPNNQCTLKLKSNFCVLTDASLIWNEHCTKGLQDRGFTRSNVDPCLFYKEDLILILYADNCCIFRTSNDKINEFIESLKRPKEKKAKSEYLCKDGEFDFIVEKSIEKILGVDVSQVDDMIMLRQPHLIERIISTVGFQDKQVC